MGDFSDHLRAAIFFGTVLAIITLYFLFSVGYSKSMVGVGAILMFMVVVVFGVAPDIDVASSIPRRYLGKILVGVITLGVLYKIVTDPTTAVSVGEQLLIFVGLGDLPPILVGSFVLVGGGVVAAKSLGYGLDEITTHRGLLHNVSFWALLGIATATGGYLIFDLSPVIAVIIFFGSVAGAVVHIKIVDRA